MLTPRLEKELDEILGREMRGKMNEFLVLILLVKNFDAAEAAKQSRRVGFRGKKDRELVREGLLTAILSKELKISQSTVGTTVGRLVNKGFVTHSKGEPVKTTEEGRNAARELLRHHRLLEVWFTESIGLSPDTAHEEAVKGLVLVSCELINTIDSRYDTPEKCPCGEEIPNSELCGDTKLL